MRRANAASTAEAEGDGLRPTSTTTCASN